MRKLAIALVVFVAACGKSDQTISYKDSEGKKQSIDVTDAGGKRTVKSADGLIKAEGTRGGANAVFPVYAPQYPSAKVVSTVNMDMAGKKVQMIVQHSNDSEDKVVAFYKSGFQNASKKIAEHKSETGFMLIEGSMTNPQVQVIVKGTPTGSTITHSVPMK